MGAALWAVSLVSLVTLTLSCFWPSYWPTIAHFYSPWLPLPFDGIWVVLLASVGGQMAMKPQRARLERTAVAVHLFAIVCIVVGVLSCLLWKGMFKTMGMDVYDFSLLAFVTYCASMTLFFMLRLLDPHPRTVPATKASRSEEMMSLNVWLLRVRLTWQAIATWVTTGLSVRPTTQTEPLAAVGANPRRLLDPRQALEHFRLMLFSSQNGRRGRG